VLTAVLLTVLPAFAGLALGTGTASAADNGTWAVYPTPASKAPDALPDRQYFYLEAAPGASVSDKVSVFNVSDHPITFRLYGADAYNTPRDGGFALRAAGQRMTGVGAWTTVDTGSAGAAGAPGGTAGTLTVPAHTRADVPITVKVPADAEPGDHPGAVVALDTTPEAGSTGNGGKVAVGIQRAVGARIYLRVSGPAVPAVTVEDVRIDRSDPLLPGLGSSRATIRYTLVNRGTVTLHPKLALKASGWFGGTVFSRGPTDLGVDLLPGQRVQLTAPWPHPPQFDHVSLKLTVTGTDVSGDASAGFLAVPWFPVGLVLLLAGLLLGARRLRARRRRVHRGGGWSLRGRVKAGAAV
jgi:hypothetical protein